MQSIRQLYHRASKLDIPLMIKNATLATQASLINLNKYQLFRGINNEGDIIGEIDGGLFGYKSSNYAFEKYKENPLPGLGNPDLFRTGAFYAGFKLVYRGDKYMITSSDSKTPKLYQNYPGIFGLGPVARKEYMVQNFIHAASQERIKQIGI